LQLSSTKQAEAVTRSDIHDVQVIFQHGTPGAVCIRETEDGPDICIPKSQCEIEALDSTDLRRGCIATLTARRNAP